MSRKNLNKKKYQSAAGNPDGTNPSGGGDATPAQERSWELKSVFFVFRAAGALFFVAYLLMTVYASYAWVWIKWAQHYPVTHVVKAADTYLNKEGDPPKLLKWMSARPAHEHDDIIRLLDVYTPKMDANAFFLFSKWARAERKMDDARFWWMMGNFRMRFDLIRCGGDAVKFMGDLMEESSAEQEAYLFRGDADLKKKTLQRVLDYDAKHPARNNPTYLCQALWRLHQNDIKGLAIMPVYTWADTRAMMRANAMRFINGEDGAPAQEKTAPSTAHPPALQKAPPKNVKPPEKK